MLDICYSNEMTKATRSTGRIASRKQSKDARKRPTSTVISLCNSDSEDEQTFKKQPRTPRKCKIDMNCSEESPVTPPKQKKVDLETSLLVTPTRKKSNNENIQLSTPNTPSTLLRNLKLTSPLKHADTRKTRKLSFEKRNHFKDARKALHSTSPTDMPGREKELEDLRRFITAHIDNRTSGSLYVSGPPGTGKTASLNLILNQDEVATEVHHVYINCTAIKSSGFVYSRIVQELKLKNSSKTEKDNLMLIEKYLTKSHKMILLILDEIDQLESKKQSVLYTIFEWPAKINSRLILIGIANALDLTDRILPRLQARCALKPKLMHFAPYSKQQIVDILTRRLEEAGTLDVFSPVALQMLAGKVASVSGDIRRALDIGRRLVELVDNNQHNVLKSVENLANELIENENNENHARSVDVKEVVNVLNNVYGTSHNLADDAEETFPLQQKIIICSLLVILKHAKNKDVTVGKLHEVYRKACTKRNLQAVDQAEFVGLCDLIETKGIMRITRKKEPRLSKINLEWDQEEVTNALKDKQLVSSILQDASCLGKL